MTITEEFAEKVRRANSVDRIMRTAPIMVLAALVLVFSCICGFNVFLAPSNLVAILKQLAIPLCVAMGLTFVIMIGSIDLSINGVVGMAGSLAGVFVANEVYNFNLGIFGVALAILCGVAVGLMIGLVHVYLRVPSFMVSFAFMYICQGIARVSYHSRVLKITDPMMLWASGASFLGIPLITWVALLMFIICYIIQEYTAFGRHVYAVGTNEAIPRSVGVSVNWVKIRVFMLGGLMSGVAGALGAIRLGIGQVSIGNNQMFPAQAAVVIGGTALAGGKGGVQRTLIGVLIMTILQNGLLMCNVSPFITDGVQGIIILICVILTCEHGKTVISK
ncbi:MAG: ABC transporter permease [Clostridia bacterium]|nr:ABC transporter permease [Clostridia bacterium]